MSEAPKPYYDAGGITIYLGDCRTILPALGAFDLLLSDPPYGISLDTDYSARGPGRNKHERVFGDDAPFDPAHLLGLSQAAILWGANNYADKLPTSACWLVWDRVSGGFESTTDAELAWVRGHRFTTVRLFQHQWCGYRRKSERVQRVLHPTQKPVALMHWCLGFFPDAKSVIDPYMGSGPVARACKDQNRRYVGIEINERYCEIAVRGLAQEVLFT